MCITLSKNEMQDLTESAGERHVITSPEKCELELDGQSVVRCPDLVS